MEKKNYYHYTTKKGLIGILETGKINLAKESVTHKKEKPVAWISTNDFWEPTATKIVRSLTGQIVQITFEEQAMNYGCARIQVKPERLMTWAKLKHVARMNMENAALMEKVDNAEPKNWYGSVFPITADKWLCIEVYYDGAWQKFDIEEFKKEFMECSENNSGDENN